MKNVNPIVSSGGLGLIVIFSSFISLGFFTRLLEPGMRELAQVSLTWSLVIVSSIYYLYLRNLPTLPERDRIILGLKKTIVVLSIIGIVLTYLILNP